MRNIEEIKKSPRLSSLEIGSDGGKGIIVIPSFVGTVIFSNGGGWEHVSVAPIKQRIIPSWDDMCMIKDIFFRDDEWVVQFHPPKEEYVNNVKNCLHLWKPLDKDMPTPPWWLVGIKRGKTMTDAMREISKYEAERETI